CSACSTKAPTRRATSRSTCRSFWPRWNVSPSIARRLPEKGPNVPTTSPSVLVIEDDEAARANLRDILEIDAYHVETVGTAAEAPRLPDLGKVGAILLDRRLPDALAEDLLPRLRQEAPEAAILIITGYADLQSAIKAMRQGASDYLLKPINPELLRSSLARL